MLKPPQRKVRLRMTLEYDREFDADWTHESIEFFLNKSSSCAGNEIAFLRELGETTDYCPCGDVEFEVLGDVDAE